MLIHSTATPEEINAMNYLSKTHHKLRRQEF
jgi:hypothetical protein